MSREFDTDFFAPSRPRVIGHRGAAGERPENTMVSFERAVAAGALYLELDVHMTSDGEIVVSHDGNLARACDREGLIAQMTRVEIQAADAGYAFTVDGGATFPFRGRGVKVPRLADVLAAFTTTNVVVEIKQTVPNLVARLLETVDRSGARRRVMLTSEQDEPVRELRKLAPKVPTNFPYTDVAELLQAMAGNRPGYEALGAAIQIPPQYGTWQLVTPELVAFAHQLGVEVHVWTVNDEREMNELLDCGVDGIISDFPARALAVVRARSATG
ncbi:MAG: glycerophosphodiester phosphodiesterase [Candidatus Binataceae bacterium]